MIKPITPPEFSIVEKRCDNPMPQRGYEPPNLSMQIVQVGDKGFRATFPSLCLAKAWVPDAHIRAHQQHLDRFVDLLCKRNLSRGIQDVEVTHSPSSSPVVRWMTDPDKNGVRRGCYDLSQYDGQTHIEWVLCLGKGRRLLY